MTNTPRLALDKPADDGTDLVNVQEDLNANFDKIDTAVGFQIVTSTTRPSSPYAGKPITESDTSYRSYFHNGTSPASAGWVEIPNSSSTFGADLTLASDKKLNIGDANLYRSAANTLKTDDSLTVTGDLTVSGIRQKLHARKPADETVTSSTTLQNDDHLVLALSANATYEFEAFLFTIETGGDFVGDIKTAFAFPAGATVHLVGAGPHPTSFTTGTSSVTEWLARPTQTSSPTQTLTYGVGSGQTALWMKGVIVVSATAGDLQLQWAQNVSDATGITVKAGSWIAAERIA